MSLKRLKYKIMLFLSRFKKKKPIKENNHIYE